MHHLRLHWEMAKLRVAARMAFRSDLALSVVSFFLAQLTAPIFASVIYSNGGRFPGWSLYEVFVLQGFWALVLGFSFTFFFGLLWFTENRMKDGTFDLGLLKPANTLWLMIMGGFDEEDFARVCSGIVLIAFGLYHVDIAGSILLALLLALFGVLFYFAVAVTFSALTIRFVRTRLYEVVAIFNTFAAYPKSVYGKSVGFVLSSILPLALIANYPASALLGFTLDGALRAVVCVIILAVASVWFWFKTLKSYSSAGG